MNLDKMIEICLKDDNMHIFVMINALICINNYVITCINSTLSATSFEDFFITPHLKHHLTKSSPTTISLDYDIWTLIDFVIRSWVC